MSRKLMITLALALVLVLVVSVGVFAQGPNPANGQNGSAVGTSTQQMQRIQDPTLNATGEFGTCDAFIDEDGDGVCDNAGLDGVGGQVGTMSRQNLQAKSQSALGGQGLGTDFVDANHDGTCDNFVDVDGDGISDIAPQDGTGSQFNRASQASQGRGRNR